MGSLNSRETRRRALAGALMGGALAASGTWTTRADAQYASLLTTPSAPAWISSGLWSALLATPELDPDPAPPSTTDGDDALLVCGLFTDGAPRLTLFDDPLFREPPAAEITIGWHADKRGEIVVYDQISRRWDRPLAYSAYVYPIDRRFGWASVTSGYDLDLPATEQRRVATNVVGHGGVDLPQVRGAPIRMIRLAHQVGDAKVLYVGRIFGNTVATLHVLREGGARAQYVLLFGHLDETSPDLELGKRVRVGDLIGAAGDSESQGGVHLHLEARRVREGVSPATLIADRIVSREATVVTDPRNVLALRPGAARGPSCRDRVREARGADALLSPRLELAPIAPLADYRALDWR